jgi:hypothetical protein
MAACKTTLAELGSSCRQPDQPSGEDFPSIQFFPPPAKAFGGPVSDNSNHVPTGNILILTYGSTIGYVLCMRETVSLWGNP